MFQTSCCLALQCFHAPNPFWEAFLRAWFIVPNQLLLGIVMFSCTKPLLGGFLKGLVSAHCSVGIMFVLCHAASLHFNWFHPGCGLCAAVHDDRSRSQPPSKWLTCTFASLSHCLLADLIGPSFDCSQPAVAWHCNVFMHQTPSGRLSSGAG